VDGVFEAAVKEAETLAEVCSFGLSKRRDGNIGQQCLGICLGA